jgi:hypothetical protein
MTEPNTQETLGRFASTISQQPLGLVAHAPEPWAQPVQCVQNVFEKVSRDGGRAICGWAFLIGVPQCGDFFIAIHHAVWIASGSTAPVDITPFHEDPIQRPYCPVSGSIAFLLDDTAQPKIIGHTIARLASRFFPASDDPKLAAYVDELRRKEQADCQRLGESALAAHLVSQRPN